MLVISILRHIEYLLSNNDCVIVPGLGAFLATWKDAEFSESSGAFTGCFRQFTFNSGLKVSDGLLITSLAREKALTYEEASRLVEKEVNVILAELNENGEFSFGRVGRLELSIMGELSFIPASTDTISPLMNWMTDVYVSDFSGEGEKHEFKRKLSREETGKLRQQKWTNFWRTAVGIIIVLLIGLTISTPLSFDKITYTASMVPPVKIPTEKSLMEENVTDNIEPVEITEAVVTENREETKTLYNHEEKKEEVSSQPTEIRFDNSDSFILVVASLATREAAEQFLLDYTYKFDYPLGIMEAGDKYRVYAATGSSGTEVMKYANAPEIKKHFKDAWVTRK